MLMYSRYSVSIFIILDYHVSVLTVLITTKVQLRLIDSSLVVQNTGHIKILTWRVGLVVPCQPQDDAREKVMRAQMSLGL